MPITSYTAEPGVFYAGMIADEKPRDGISRRNAETTLNVPAGCFLVQDPTAADGAKLPRQTDFASGAVPGFLGVNLKIDRMPNADGTTGTAPKEMMSVGRAGRFTVIVEDAVALADLYKAGRVRMRVLASGGNTQLGAARNSADTDVDSVAFINGAVFCRAVSAGGVTIVEIPDGATLTLGS